MLSRRSVAFQGTALTLSLLAPGHHAQAQATTWPDRPVRVVVPFGPGGAIDILIRILAPHFPRSAMGRTSSWIIAPVRAAPLVLRMWRRRARMAAPC